MKKRMLIGLLAYVCGQGQLVAHCQMPCGIYHDNMVYDQIDQYVETMYKCISVLNDSKFTTPKERNEFVRWVLNKENSSDEMASLITKYFLQQKIKSGETDTPARLASAHKLLFLLMQIKQCADRDIINQFADIWEEFKLMFHVEGYSCKVETIKMRKLEQKQEQLLKNTQDSKVITQTVTPTHDEHDHDHDHDDHDHPHAH